MTEAAKPQPIILTIHTEELKERCLEVVAKLAECGGMVIIFHDGEPIVQMTQFEEPPLNGYGSMKGQIKIHGDIVSPLPPEWYASNYDEENLI